MAMLPSCTHEGLDVSIVRRSSKHRRLTRQRRKGDDGTGVLLPGCHRDADTVVYAQRRRKKERRCRVYGWLLGKGRRRTGDNCKQNTLHAAEI